MSLTLRGRAEHHRDLAARIHRDPHVLGGAGLLSTGNPLLGRRRDADVAQVRSRGVDDRRQPDPEQAPLRAGAVAPAAQFLVAAARERELERRAVVTGVVQAAGRRRVRERVGVDQVAAP